MLELTILSPHPDDAAFSLSGALHVWSRRHIHVCVVNFFTRTEYGPGATSVSSSTISSLRRREDHSALLSIDRRIRLEAFNLLDAPLRFGVSAKSVCRRETAALQSNEEIDRLAFHIRKYLKRGLVLAPLALGDHVDHLAVNRATLTYSTERRFAFYEDLPYATWTMDSSLLERVSSIEKVLHVHLKPVVIRNHNCAVSYKFRIASRYRSQITRQEAISIARHALKYRGGERIWIPRYSAAWRALAR